MQSDPSLARAADDTAGRQPNQAGQPGKAASLAEAVPVGKWGKARRFDLEWSRGLTIQLLIHLSDGVQSKLFFAHQPSVERLKDPFLTFNRAQRELRRIIALAERLEEDDCQRAARLAAEKAKAAKAAEDAAIWREANARFRAKEKKKGAIQNAVRFALEDAWDDEDADDAVPSDSDDNDDDDSWDGDPVVIVAKLCTRLGLKPEEDRSVDIDDGGKPVERQARTLELARDYLIEAGWVFAPEPAANAPVVEEHPPPDG